MFKLIKVGGTF